MICSSPAKDKAPFFVWNGSVPKLDHIRVFGCISSYTVPKLQVQKLDDRARESIFFGYADHCKGCKVMDAQTREIIISRVALFEKDKVTTCYHACLEVDTGSDAEPTPDVKQKDDLELHKEVGHDSVLKHNGLTDGNPDIASSCQKDFAINLKNERSLHQDFDPRRLERIR